MGYLVSETMRLTNWCRLLEVAILLCTINLLQCATTAAQVMRSQQNNSIAGLGSVWSVMKPGQNLTVLQSPNMTFVLDLSLVNDSSNSVSCVASIQHMASGLQVWVANFYNTTNSSHTNSAGNLNCSLGLGGNGNLMMTTTMDDDNNVTATTTWSSNTASKGVGAMQLLENGNLVLSATTKNSAAKNNDSGVVVWQSFNYPTDTIITGQMLKNTSVMYAAMSTQAYSSGGTYSLRVQTFTNDLSLFADFHSPSNYLLLQIPAANQSFGADRYWTANTEFMVQQDAWVCCGGSYAELSNGLSVYDSQGYTTISTSSNNLNPNLTFLEYARVLPDGNLQSFVFRDGTWKLNFEALTNPCQFPNACGSYGICKDSGVSGSNDDVKKSFCHGCPPGFRAVNQTDLSMGCEALEVLAESCSATAGGRQSRDSPAAAIELVNATGVSYFAVQQYYYFGTPSPVYPSEQVLDVQACKSLCESNCSCSAAVYNPDISLSLPNFSTCFLLPSALQTLMQGPTYENQTLFIKIPKGSPLFYDPPSPSPSPTSSSEAAPAPSPSSSSSPSLSTVGNNKSSRGSSLSTRKEAAIGVAAGSVGVIGIVLFLSARFLHRSRKRMQAQRMAQEEDEMFLDTLPGLPPRLSYKELVIATGNFSKKLGKGGFGSVYEGVLADQQRTRVAVKQLEDIGQGTKEFRAEVATIGNISHVNLVPLRGFCVEGQRNRLLVYAFMPNGSLDKICFRKKKTTTANTEAEAADDAEVGIVEESPSELEVLDWKTRQAIAVGTARGLAYLHEGCRSRIIHCDVKPENILLDEQMQPRVADFGLAKLMRRDQSYRVTTMRGTRGYMAPEWVKDVPITEKSDVFSFGIVLLELISGRRNFDLSAGEDKCFLPAWTFSLLDKGGKNLLEIVDESLQISQTSSMNEGEQQQQQACRNMILVALWCIQEEISLRPTMSTVLKMLEGDEEIVDPPICSYFLDCWLGSPAPSSSSSPRAESIRSVRRRSFNYNSSSSSSAAAAAPAAASSPSSSTDQLQIAFTSTQGSQISEVVPR